MINYKDFNLQDVLPHDNPMILISSILDYNANDLMEANIIDDIFSENIYCSSTKSLTGHCLGAAAALEVALCCHCIKNNVVIPHCYDGFYDK